MDELTDQYKKDNIHIFYENNTNGFINLLLKEGITPVELNRKIQQINEEEAIEKFTTNNQFLLSLDIHSGLMAILNLINDQ